LNNELVSNLLLLPTSSDLSIPFVVIHQPENQFRLIGPIPHILSKKNYIFFYQTATCEVELNFM